MTRECQKHFRTVTALGYGGIEVRRKDQALVSLLGSMRHLVDTQTGALGYESARDSL